MNARYSIGRAVAVYGKPRLLAVFGLGIASGFPLTLILSTLGYWLARKGISKGEIGLFAVMLTPYTLKFLWAPLVDHLRLPLLGRWFGQRRSWLFLVQALMTAAILGLAAHNPTTELARMAAFAFAVAFLSATQDIVIDAYRIEILSEREQGPGAAMINFGYRTGNLVAGAGALLLVDDLGWTLTYDLMALLVLFGTLAALLVGEPARHDAVTGEQEETKAEAFIEARGHLPGPLARAGAWLYAAAGAPFVEFLARRGAVLILLFVVVYKIGDAMGQVMMPPLLVDLGFSNAEIAVANKTVTFIALMIGTAIGGSLVYAIGMFRALFVTGVAMMATNLMFAALAMVGHSVWFLVLTVALENFATGMGAAVFVAWLSGLCNLAFTATQYALLSSLASVARTWLAAPSGFLADSTGWVGFYLLTTVAALPGLLLLWLLWRMGFEVRPSSRGSDGSADDS